MRPPRLFRRITQEARGTAVPAQNPTIQTAAVHGVRRRFDNGGKVSLLRLRGVATSHVAIREHDRPDRGFAETVDRNGLTVTPGSVVMLLPIFELAAASAVLLQAPLELLAQTFTIVRMDAIEEMAADQFGFADRGRIAVGRAADLVVFDAATVADRATYDQPHQYPEGIAHVLVNGVLVVTRGAHTQARPGQVLAHH